ncbi:integrase catalytic domain-containing protein [Trichonephila clavipes]|nr:integrase catalytic domain-containing protein [Trichonephila clavipes]
MKGDDGLIRVETRVSCRKDLETFRYPILLPNTHQLVKKLIMEKHIELEHAGTQTLMSNLRESYWIIKSRKTIRQVVRSCITCKRFSARPLETVSIPLPEDRWKFSPPSAPWWGGFWERLVGMLKNVLRKVLGKASLNEELNTLLCDAESIINSRPITYLSEDPKDLVALTPAMFLQEIREIGVPDFDMIDSKKLERRFIYRNQLANGKIIKSFPGKDGRIRVVEVKTPSGNFIRPIQKLYPLEVNLPEASDFRERIQKDQKNQEISTSRRGRTLRPPKRLEL